MLLPVDSKVSNQAGRMFNQLSINRMRKPRFYVCENKDADQLRGNFKPLAIFCSCTAWFVSDQVGNQNVGFLMTWLILLFSHGAGLVIFPKSVSRYMFNRTGYI